jgi:MYXO-CTERM domain-containing protein
VASDLRGAGIPLDYGGQCYANYPGNEKADCGVPIPGVVSPRPPEGSPVDGGAFFARAAAAGDPEVPEKLTASGITEGGGMAIAEVVQIGFSQSRSRTFIDADGVHAVTAAAAENIQVGDALRIANLTARAEAVHNGDLEAATGSAATTFTGVTIGGVPVEIGPEGVTVQGQKVADAPSPEAAEIRDAMAAEGMTVEPLAGPAIAKDEATGFVAAETRGLRVLIRRPSGDRFDLTFGDATARVSATRASASESEDDLFLTQDDASPGAAPAAAAGLLALPARRRRS